MVLRLEQVQRAVEIYFFSNLKLILGLGHVIEKKFKDHGAAKASTFYFEIGKPLGKVETLNILYANKRWALHCAGKPVADIRVRSTADVVGAILAETLAADVFIAGFAVIAAEPTALVAKKLHFILLRLRQGVELFKFLV